MTDRRDHAGARERERADACLRDLQSAREQLRLARRSVPGSDLRGLRVELLGALESYAAAIGRLGAPVPLAIRNEIALYRHLGDRA